MHVNGKHIDTITLDWETFYTSEYSLSKMTTQQYVMSPYFEVILIAVKVNDEKTVWFSGTSKQVKKWLLQFPWESSVAIAHNALFDGSILEWHFGIRPKQWLCTMMAARPLCAPYTPNGRVGLKHVAEYLSLGQKGTEVLRAIGKQRRDFSPQELEQYAAYCVNDTNLCYQIAEKLAPQLPVFERDLISATIEKYTRPKLLLDRNVLSGRLTKLREEKQNILVKAGLTDRSLLMSNPMFADALRMLNVTPPTKISPRTGKETYAFAKNDGQFKVLLDHDDYRVQTLVAARLKHKSTQEETRLSRFIEVADAMGKVPNGRFGIPLLYYGAHTGRFSGFDKLNLQNLPRGSKLRAALVAPPGHVVVAGDLSQIEARILATLAGEHSLVDAFRTGVDIYAKFASKLYNRRIQKGVDNDERFVGKTAVLGLGYQMGHEKFRNQIMANNIDITLLEARRIVDMYRNLYPKIPLFWSKMSGVIGRMHLGMRGDLGCIKIMKNAIILPNGMRLIYPELHEGEDGWVYKSRGCFTKLYGGKLTENLVQALARIIVSTTELMLYHKGWPAALQVHDELVYVIPENKAHIFARVLNKALVQPVPWLPNLPLAAEVNIGKNYAEAK